MAARINLNADAGEGYGAYEIGDDDALLGVVASVNVACGMHGGDPTIMRRLMGRAAARGVSIGAHPGFNDLWGFGRRRIVMAASDLENLVAYQIGAAQAMAACAGAAITHVKVHGALHNMASEDLEVAAAVARAVTAVDPSLIHLVTPRTALERAAQELDAPLAREAFIDRAYEASGLLTPRGVPGATIDDPEAAAEQALRIALEGCVIARTGERAPIDADSLCVHGDAPGAAARAQAARAALESAGVRIATLPEMTRARPSAL